MDVLITNAEELWPLRPGPLRKEDLDAIDPIWHGFVAFEAGRVVDVGEGPGPLEDAHHVLDASGRTVVPGLVDGHTHPVFLGERSRELAWKLEGLGYTDIQARGGGIQATTDATRAGSLDDLVAATEAHLAPAARAGVTLAEAKSGYHLTPDGERLALEALQQVTWPRVSPTFLGGHLIPSDAQRGRFIDDMTEATAAVAETGLAEACDAFIDVGALTLDEGRTLLEAGRDAGLACRVHADELERSGAARLGVDLGARSLDHLNRLTAEDIEHVACQDVCCTLCPGTPFTTPGVAWPPARDLYEAGGVVALGTDLNPNAWVADPWLVWRLAVHQLRLPPVAALAALTANPAWSLERPSHGHLQRGAEGGAVILDAPSLLDLAYRMRPVDAEVVRGEPGT